MKVLALVVFCLLLAGCQNQKHVYRITFTNGDVDYYELDYKPKAGANTIKYYDETILGVEKIEKID